MRLLLLVLVLCSIPVATCFVSLIAQRPVRQLQHFSAQRESLTVRLDTTLDDEKIAALFAWISRAFEGDDDRYNNLMLAVAAVFGNLPNNSAPALLLQQAIQSLPAEDALTGEPFSRYERESASMGAMGAGQWTGQYRTRPHALLCLSQQNYTTVDDWVATLPRGCRRTILKALAHQANFTVDAQPIVSNQAAPHSSLAHFRCVVEHEVRLLTSASMPDENDMFGWANDDLNAFINAVAEATSRYMGTTRMTGEIRTYRDAHTGRVLAFCHEVRKGRTLRGQWFYATHEAAQRYIWFHSVYSLVQRAIECHGKGEIDAVDLGPSGSDGFSDLKARYGFRSVTDWPRLADYTGPFWDYETNAPAQRGVTW
jgi:hypothetical protein